MTDRQRALSAWILILASAALILWVVLPRAERPSTVRLRVDTNAGPGFSAVALYVDSTGQHAADVDADLSITGLRWFAVTVLDGSCAIVVNGKTVSSHPRADAVACLYAPHPDDSKDFR